MLINFPLHIIRFERAAAVVRLDERRVRRADGGGVRRRPRLRRLRRKLPRRRGLLRHAHPGAILQGILHIKNRF